MGRQAGLIVGAVAGAVLSGLLFLIKYRFADHDSWARALILAGGWVLFMTVFMVGYQLGRDRRVARAVRVGGAPRSQS